MNPSTVLRLISTPDTADANASEDYFLAPEKLITGNPKQTLWMHYTDPTRQYVVGLWRSEPGKWRVRYTEEEYCRMLEGVSVITDEAGHAVTVRAGDEFVVPRGFVGTWEVVETSTKRFVIYEKTPG
ncbi:cupin domain-containing protein [Hylemonella gracilis]|uniref:(S)-ureidoglycine aminohydrolase cupin domain-containing protein n=1 Tax=Hylemonella gracilis ATCC 19624 TaxID=887062 RepID=F3KRZ8_9BURK|nr:cupin domain-containing protein [Hylemonella gracilis]EGI77482.1 hypothetical protein HGR_06136 [Hylemonella gracilis ATCC 19624]